jgi:uncharacterized membrane protein (DUF4010 family)
LAITALVAMLLVSYAIGARQHLKRGITTEVAALLTFLLGATAAADYLSLSASVAVVAALILGLKPQLHAWVASLEKEELLGALKLLLISVVLLPVLPDAGYGPWKSLNPYQIWWLVVLIATIGFMGYFAMKLAGPRAGAILTGLFGGLASSTAVALNFSRMGRSHEKLGALLASGIVVASATMFPRILVEVSVINTQLLRYVAPVLLGMTVAAAGAAIWLWRTGRGESLGKTPLELPNPFELLPALQFGALLVLIMLAAKASAEWFGSSGAYALAIFSGIADVDAITLSMARLAGNAIELDTAAFAIILAAFTNTVAKGLLVLFIGGTALARHVGYAFGVTLLTGALLTAAIPFMQ